jgi:hypothetical protein
MIYRGSWALTHILDDPPPPPPLEVPELLPFDKANQGKSFRELLVQHQADDKCSICHKKMDPLGFAFQNFDLSGRWRNVEHERYHRAETGRQNRMAQRRQDAAAWDSAGHLPRRQKFASFQECKELLAKHYLDDIVRGLLKKLTLYGTGAAGRCARSGDNSGDRAGTSRKGIFDAGFAEGAGAIEGILGNRLTVGAMPAAFRTDHLTINNLRPIDIRHSKGRSL